ILISAFVGGVIAVCGVLILFTLIAVLLGFSEHPMDANDEFSLLRYLLILTGCGATGGLIYRVILWDERGQIGFDECAEPAQDFR
ncbi:MAG: hypothetical protein AAGE76_12735, partial [Pseudomonadota bacterium]